LLDKHTCRAISIDANFNIPASRASKTFFNPRTLHEGIFCYKCVLVSVEINLELQSSFPIRDFIVIWLTRRKMPF
jgi:hypothetical protein